MKVLVACEESQAVTKEFRKLGHEAYSCDTLPCSGGHPEWHLQQDVTELLKQNWDMIIAFPPCTFISNAGACRLYPTKGKIDKKRYHKGLKGKEFFMLFYNSACRKVAIENPVSSKVFKMPEHTQEIQPYEYGHPVSKKTRLWLKGLEPLEPTNIVEKKGTYLPSGTSRYKGTNKNKGTSQGSLMNSKTFPGIAKAMAEQWGGTLNRPDEMPKIVYHLTKIVTNIFQNPQDPHF
jgi:hypothetical protein